MHRSPTWLISHEQFNKIYLALWLTEQGITYDEDHLRIIPGIAFFFFFKWDFLIYGKHFLPASQAPPLPVRLYLNAVCILLQDCHVKYIFSKYYKYNLKYGC